MDVDRTYRSPLRRQKNRIAFVRELLPVFVQCRDEIGAFASLNEIARWMNEHNVPTGPGKSGLWFPDTVKSFVEFDGIDPTPEALSGTRNKKLGMRVSIMRGFEECYRHIERECGEDGALEERKRVEQHCQELKMVAQSVRLALGKK